MHYYGHWTTWDDVWTINESPDHWYWTFRVTQMLSGSIRFYPVTRIDVWLDIIDLIIDISLLRSHTNVLELDWHLNHARNKEKTISYDFSIWWLCTNFPDRKFPHLAGGHECSWPTGAIAVLPPSNCIPPVLLLYKIPLKSPTNIREWCAQQVKLKSFLIYVTNKMDID